MSFFDRLRSLFSGPPRMADGGDPETKAVVRDEYGTPDAGEEVARTDEALHEAGTGSGSGTAEEDLESEEAPPDPAP